MKNKFLINIILSCSAFLFIACGADTPSPETSKVLGFSSLDKVSEKTKTRQLKPLNLTVYISAKRNENKVWIPQKISDIDNENRVGIDVLTLDVKEDGTAELLAFRDHKGHKVSCQKAKTIAASVCDGKLPFSSSTRGLSYTPFGTSVLQQHSISYFMNEFHLFEKVSEFKKTRTEIENRLEAYNVSLTQEREQYNGAMPEYTLKIKDSSGLYDDSIDFKSNVEVRYNKLELAKPYHLASMDVSEETVENVFYNRELAKFSKHLSRLKKHSDEKSAYVKVRYEDKPSNGYKYTIDGAETMFLKEKYTVNVDVKTKDVSLTHPFVETSEHNISKLP